MSAYPLHDTIEVVETGMGQEAATGHRVKPGKGDIWNPECSVVPKVAVKGKSKKPLKMSPLIEFNRFKRIQRLRNVLDAECKKSSVIPPLLAFERWLANAKLGENSSIPDPLLPNIATAEEGLISDLSRVNLSHQYCTAIALKLASESSKACKDILKLVSTSKSDPLSVEVVPHKHTVDLTYSGKLLKLNISHYEKLQTLYAKFGKGNFNDDLYCMLLRYHTIQGHGFQSALCEMSFEVLRTHFSVEFECFASPLNCRYARYCSAFIDTDAAFGSMGDFFNFYPVTGSFEANPPFIPGVMKKLVEHIELVLSSSKKSLSFVLIVPGWRESESWSMIEESQYNRATWMISKDDHGFCDGAQHQRQDRYRESPFDTAVVFMQNDAGKARWPISKESESEFRSSIALSVPTPAMVARRRKAGRGHSSADKPEYKKSRFY